MTAAKLPRLCSVAEASSRSPLRSAVVLLALSLAAQMHGDKAIAVGAHDLVVRGLREGWLAPAGAAL